MDKSEWRYAVLLALFIIPAAVFANFIRVVVIILITYYFGDEAGQGFLHTSTGMLLFVVTLLSVFLLDRLLSPLRMRLSGKARGAVSPGGTSTFAASARAAWAVNPRWCPPR